MSSSDQQTQFVIVNNDYSGLCNVTIGVINRGGILSSLMKVNIAFQRQIAQQRYGEGVTNAILIHEIQVRDSYVDQSS